MVLYGVLNSKEMFINQKPLCVLRESFPDDSKICIKKGSLDYSSSVMDTLTALAQRGRFCVTLLSTSVDLSRHLNAGTRPTTRYLLCLYPSPSPQPGLLHLV